MSDAETIPHQNAETGSEQQSSISNARRTPTRSLSATTIDDISVLEEDGDPSKHECLSTEVGSLGGASTDAESIDHVVSMIKIEQQDWVEEVLNDGVVSMLDIQFDNMIRMNQACQQCKNPLLIFNAHTNASTS